MSQTSVPRKPHKASVSATRLPAKGHLRTPINRSSRLIIKFKLVLKFPKPTLCPEKDTDPEKDTKKGGKGVTPIKQRQRQEHISTSLAITKTLSNKPGAGPHSNRQIHRTVFEAARIATYIPYVKHLHFVSSVILLVPVFLLKAGSVLPYDRFDIVSKQLTTVLIPALSTLIAGTLVCPPSS